jgi:hypothetical protein
LDEELAREVPVFLDAPKQVRARFRWISKSSIDWAEARLMLQTAGDGAPMGGQIRMTVHKKRIPAKYSFALLYRNQRVFGLDVNPARGHMNPDTLESIRCTHWQLWPCTRAEADDRIQSHERWFREFLKRAKVTFPFRYRPPPDGTEQLEMEFAPWTS